MRGVADLGDPYGLLGDAGALSDMLALARRLPAASSQSASASCGACAAPVSCGVDGRRVCRSCGLVGEPEEEVLPTPVPLGRLRVVGIDSGMLQPDLYRSACDDPVRAQQRHTLDEYARYCEHYLEKGGRSFPHDARAIAAGLYSEVQANGVRRSENKKSIMASCLYYACNKVGIAPTKKEFAKALELKRGGIARGNNHILDLVAQGKMSIDVNQDTLCSAITSVFALMQMEGSAYAGLRSAVLDIVDTMVENNIAINSIQRSKVAAATFTVLARCLDAGLVPLAPDLKKFCADCNIRATTVSAILKKIDEYRRFFVPCYARAGLRTEKRSANSPN
jgi:hypothetical protein